jgi:DNA polymerase III subunit beta
MVRFKTERDAFAEAVAWVGRTVSTRPTLPVLGGILLELGDDRMRLASTDLEHTGEAVIQVQGDADGRVVVPGRVFGDIVRNLPAGVVDLEAADGSLQVRCGTVSHELRLLDADDFPSLAQPSLEQVGKLPGEVLAVAANQVAKAAGNDEGRPVLTAVLFEAEAERLTLAATDSYRLALREIPWTWEHEPTTALVPARALAEAARALSGEESVEIGFEPHQVTFVGGGRRLTSRLVEGEFPPVRNLLPSGYENLATVSRQVLLDACKQVAPYGQNNNPVRLSLEGDQIEVTSDLKDVGKGNAMIEAKYAGEPVTVGFNPSYLADGVNGVEDSEVVLEVRDSGKPALIHGNDRKGFTYLIMPVRMPS